MVKTIANINSMKRTMVLFLVLLIVAGCTIAGFYIKGISRHLLILFPLILVLKIMGPKEPQSN
jgi:hypothetical protein